MNCPTCGHDIIDDAAFCPWCDARIPDGPTYDDYVYEAFISYRHLPHDHEIAERLQRSIEGFAIPKALRKDQGRMRLGKLFRDEDELPTSSSLPDQIDDALRRSHMLIVVCSPKTRESMWVQREVERFATYHGRNRIRIALAEGEPDESFPELLMSKTIVNPDGGLAQKAEEPLAADFRDTSRKHFDAERLRLVASLIGCGYDDLRQRMRARRQRIALAAAAAISAVSVAFGSFALWQRTQIRENLRQAQINESELLAEEALKLYDQGDRIQAIAVALSALPQSSESDDRPFVPTAQMALERALNLYPNMSSDSTYWTTDYSLRGFEEASTAYAANGAIASCNAEGTIVVFDRDGMKQHEIEVQTVAHRAEDKDHITAAPLLCFIEKQLLYVVNDVVALYDLESEKQVWSLDIENCNSNCAVAVSKDQKHFTLTVPGEKPNTKRTIVANVSSGAVESEFTLDCPDRPDDELYLENPCAVFSDDGLRLAIGINGYVFAINLETGETARTKLAQEEAASLQFRDNGLLVLSEQPIHTHNEDRLTQSATVQLLDDTLDELWSYTTEERFYVNDKGEYLNSTAGLYGQIPSRSDSETGELVLVRSAAVVLDAQTGSETWRYETKDSVLDCLPHNGSAFYLATGAGDLLFLSPQFEASLIFRQNDAQLGEATAAHFYATSIALWNENPSKCRIYDMGGMGLLANDDFVLQAVDIESRQELVSCENGFLSIEGICLIDSYYLQAERTVPLTRLPLLEGVDHPGLYRRGRGNLYAYGPVAKSEQEQSAIYILSPEGSAADTLVTLDGMTLDSDDRTALKEYDTPEGTAVLLIHDQSHIALLELGTNKELLRIECDEQVWDCWYAHGKIIASLGYTRTLAPSERMLIKRLKHSSLTNSGISLVTFDAADGSKLPSAWDDVRPWNSLSSCVSIDGLGERLAIACDDGYVRLYSIAQDNLIWESPDAASGFLSVYAGAESGNVLMQDDAGYVNLLSSTDGSLLKTSSTTLDCISSYRATLDADVVDATYENNDEKESSGLIVISLDPECFGPVSVIPRALFRNEPGSLVALCHGFQKTVCTCLCPQLDDVRGFADIQLEYCPVTDYERQIYGIKE